MKSQHILTLTSTFVVLLITILACGAPSASPTQDIAAVVAQTQTAIALEQLLTATSGAQKSTPTHTAQTPSPRPQSESATPSITPTSPSPDCTNKAKFENETIPDDTIFPPGEPFIKTWTLRNVGTCTWTPDYSVIFTKGEQMGGTSPSPIGETIPPDGTIQLYLPQTAPQENGSHQGFWKLHSPSGQDFGLGENADVAFWVKIFVKEGAASRSIDGDIDLGAPTWVNSFDGQSATFDLGSDEKTSFDLKNGTLVMTAIVPNGDLWRVSSGYIDDFAMEAGFKTGPSCSGKDSYGLLVRAPDQADSIIDSGYVFAFSCDGQYRAYRMDNGTFNGLSNWTAHPSIRAGSSQDNVMLVKAVGENFQLYANGQLAFEFADGAYPSGLFGLMVRSDGTSNFSVIVEQIAYWNIGP